MISVEFLREYYDILTILCSLGISGAIFTIFMCINNLLYSAPPTQFNQVIKYLHEDDKGKNLLGKKESKNLDKEKASLNRQVAREAREEELKNWIEISYLRLGKNLTYDDYKQECKKLSAILTITGIILALLGLVMVNFIFIMIGVLCLSSGVLFAPTIVQSKISNQINNLNQQQIREMPMLISRFISIASITDKMTINKVLENYLPYSTAMRFDIRRTLADSRSRGPRESLTLWQNRVSVKAGSKMIDCQTSLEKFKKLYEKGDASYCKSELGALRTRFTDKYIIPFVKKKSSKKFLHILLIMLSSVIILGFILILPTLLSVVEGMGSFKNM